MATTSADSSFMRVWIKDVGAEEVRIPQGRHRNVSPTTTRSFEGERDDQVAGLLRALCECADTSCRALLPLTHRQYEDIRENPRWFINAPGHHVNENGSVRIVADHDCFVIVEKIGEAGEVAEQLDQRPK